MLHLGLIVRLSQAVGLDHDGRVKRAIAEGTPTETGRVAKAELLVRHERAGGPVPAEDLLFAIEHTQDDLETRWANDQDDQDECARKEKGFPPRTPGLLRLLCHRYLIGRPQRTPAESPQLTHPARETRCARLLWL
ncbi:MAG: hypothetical protein KKI02_01750 [Planctomycetes bacterium]|nr:hypothetical protein [Planctomycetota bacterium]